MKTWNVTDSDGTLSEAVLAARCCGPQRVTLDEEVDFMVLSEEEYARLAGEPPAMNGTNAPDGGGAEGAVALLQPKSAEAAPERQWVWQWDEESQSYVLPWARDVDPAEQPGLEFLNSMQNSPLAQAFRDGDFTPEEWDAACRIGR